MTYFVGTCSVCGVRVMSDRVIWSWGKPTCSRDCKRTADPINEGIVAAQLWRDEKRRTVVAL